MIALSDIKAPVQQEMSYFENYFRDSMKSKVPLLSIITNYILRRKGKQMRPLLVLLSAKLFGPIHEGSYVGASLIELLHTASLIHDDVVDEANERRGAFSINALWKSKIAVLVGDYLLARGLLLSVDRERYDLLKIVSKAVKEISEGELLQIEKSRKLDITEEVYYDIIRQKTASLIAACTAIGAKSVHASDDIVVRMHSFGEALGMAFQIKDDLFDFQPKGLIGKPVGNDIKEKKLTLPLIFVLRNATAGQRKHWLRIISRHHNKAERVREVVEFVKQNGGLEYAETKMLEYKQKAIDILREMPENEARTALENLVEFAIKRQK